MFEQYNQDYFNDIITDVAEENGYKAIEGTFVYNVSAVLSTMLEDCFDTLEEAWSNCWADTCDREQLIRFAQMRGLEPEEGFPTRITIVSTGEIEEGTIISDGTLNFEVQELTDEQSSGTHTYYAECEEEGTEGNAIAVGDTLVNGNISATVASIVVFGEDDEDTEDFRDRYFESFGVSGQFGNEEFYLQQAKNVEGVGNAWLSFDNSTGKITLKILAEDGQQPTQALINLVKSSIYVSLGHTLDVVAAVDSDALKIDAHVTVNSDYTVAQLESAMTAIIMPMLNKVNLQLANKNSSSVTFILSKAKAKLLDLDGVDDGDIKFYINGTEKTTNITSTKIFTLYGGKVNVVTS